MHWTRSLRAFLVAAACVAPFGAPAADPVEYLPTSHPAYEDLESLWTRGVLDSLNLSSRPWSRVEIARALAAVEPGRGAADPILHRLRREFAKELLWLGRDDGPRETAPLVSVREDASEFRVSVGVEGTAGGAPASKARIAPGSGGFVRLRGYLSPSLFVLSEVRAQRTGTDRRIGDSLIRNEDLFLDTGETYLSFSPRHFEVALGLTETRWGPGSEGTLLLSDAAAPYATIRVRKKFAGRLEFGTLSGILVQSDHRHLAAHRVTLHVTPNLSIGVGEAARYDAESPDLLYLLNLVPYTLVERFSSKNRELSPAIDPRNNILMSADAVWRIRPRARVWAEFLLDDFATEESDTPHRMAAQAGTALYGSVASVPFEVLLEATKVLRFTYAVFYDRNFTFAGDPLGYEHGPDVEHFRVRVKADPDPDWSAALEVSLRRQGEGYLGEYWARGTTLDPWSGLDLTGVVESTIRVVPSLAWIPRDNVRVHAGAGLRHVRNAGHATGAHETDPEVFLRLSVRK